MKKTLKLMIGYFRYQDMLSEMTWQKKLRTTPLLCKAAQHMSLWSSISAGLAVLLNLLVAVFYPFGQQSNCEFILCFSCSYCAFLSRPGIAAAAAAAVLFPTKRLVISQNYNFLNDL